MFYQMSGKSEAVATLSSNGNTGLSFAQGSPPPGICVTARQLSTAVRLLPVCKVKVSTGNWIRVVCVEETRKDVCDPPPYFSVFNFV